MVYNKHLVLAVCALLTFGACSGGGGSDDPVNPSTPPSQPSQPEAKLPINISTKVFSRATDTNFEAGDNIGLFVVNHNADGSAAELKVSGNHVDNMKYTYNGTWVPATQTYWSDNKTHADFYLYYPYTANIGSVEAMAWKVNADQSNEANYKAGDLLIGKTSDVTPTENAVKIDAKHVMSQMKITVAPGNGFTEATLAAAKVNVKVNGLKTQGSVNLATATAAATGEAATITPMKDDGIYKALIMPQTAGKGNLITVSVDDRNYNLSTTEDINFETGKSLKFTVTVSKTSNGVNVNITKWEDDGKDYGGTAE